MNTSCETIGRILTILKQRFTNPGAMELGTPFRTLVGVILSARTRDEQVLKLLPGLFEAFPTPREFASASVEEIEAKINTIGMYRQKAKHLKSMATDLVEKFEGEVPQTMEELVSLAGVGRKTASVVLVACFDTPAIAVDTHVHRVTNRLGWVQESTPQKTEAALLKIIPAEWMRLVNQVFVKFGRYICLPGKPRCWTCPIRDVCPVMSKNLQPPKDADKIISDIDRREAILEQLRKDALS